MLIKAFFEGLKGSGSNVYRREGIRTKKCKELREVAGIEEQMGVSREATPYMRAPKSSMVPGEFLKRP